MRQDVPTTFGFETKEELKTKTMTTPTLSASEKRNTVRFDVSEEEFGKMVKGPVYLSKITLTAAFGHLPKKIRLIVEEVE